MGGAAVQLDCKKLTLATYSANSFIVRYLKNKLNLHFKNGEEEKKN
jgi:hypothetical protein